MLVYEKSLNLDVYLGKPKEKKFRDVEIKEKSRLELIGEREEKKKQFINSVYNKYKIENDVEIDYEELKKRYRNCWYILFIILLS